MPTQDNQPGLLGSMFGGVRDRFRRERQGLRNAVPGTSGFDWRQAVDAISSPFVPGDLYASQNPEGDRWFWERTANNVRGWLGNRSAPGAALPGDPSQPLPNYGQTGQPPSGMPAMPNYQDPNAYGPPGPSPYGNGQGMFPMPSAGQAGRQGAAGRFGTTIAAGPAAVAFARGVGAANSGLGARGGGGASSYGRDQLNRRQRMG